MAAAEQDIRCPERGLNELAAQVQAGDVDAFRSIVERCNQRLFRIARGVLSSDADAEDAVQDAYVSAFRKIHSFRGTAAFSTWLTRIVLNVCYQRLRRQKSRHAVSNVESLVAWSALRPDPTRYSMEDPVADASRAQLRGVLEQAIDTLSADHRTVLILRDIEQVSTAEAAAVLNIDEATVRTRLFRARRMLRETLESTITATLPDAFYFMGVRCARLTSAVMERVRETSLTDSH